MKHIIILTALLLAPLAAAGESRRMEDVALVPARRFFRLEREAMTIHRDSCRYCAKPELDGQPQSGKLAPYFDAAGGTKRFGLRLGAGLRNWTTDE